MQRLCLVFLGVFSQDYSSSGLQDSSDYGRHYGNYQIREPTCALIYGQERDMIAKVESFGMEEYFSSMPKFSIIDIYLMLSQAGKQAISDVQAIKSNQLAQFTENCKKKLKGFSLRKAATASTNRQALEITINKAVQLLQRMGVKRGLCKKLKDFLDNELNFAFGNIDKARDEFGDEAVDDLMEELTEFRKEELNDNLAEAHDGIKGGLCAAAFALGRSWNAHKSTNIQGIEKFIVQLGSEVERAFEYFMEGKVSRYNQIDKDDIEDEANGLFMSDIFYIYQCSDYRAKDSSYSDTDFYTYQECWDKFVLPIVPGLTLEGLFEILDKAIKSTRKVHKNFGDFWTIVESEWKIAKSVLSEENCDKIFFKGNDELHEQEEEYWKNGGTEENILQNGHHEFFLHKTRVLNICSGNKECLDGMYENSLQLRDVLFFVESVVGQLTEKGMWDDAAFAATVGFPYPELRKFAHQMVDSAVKYAYCGDDSVCPLLDEKFKSLL